MVLPVPAAVVVVVLPIVVAAASLIQKRMPRLPSTNRPFSILLQ
jgi:hypothetical protein